MKNLHINWNVWIIVKWSDKPMNTSFNPVTSMLHEQQVNVAIILFQQARYNYFPSSIIIIMEISSVKFNVK